MKRLFMTLAVLFTVDASAQADMASSANAISKHYAALPSTYDFDAVPQEQLSDKIIRQYVMGAQSMLVKWTLKKGAVIALHFHPNEQITWITKGTVRVNSQGKEFTVKAGQVFIIPPYVPHEFHALEDTIDIDYFTPVRNDWLTGDSPAYIQQSVKKK